MPPNTSEYEVITKLSTMEKQTKDLSNCYKTLWGYFDQEIKWFNAIMLFVIHLWAVYAVIILFKWEMFPLFLYHYVFRGFICGFGVTAGAHRYYTHKCFKAKLPLRIIMMLAYSASSQNKLYDWVRDHRVHHKYSETDADPHNSNRGFFFAHCGWLMLKKRPEVLEKGRAIDCSDILSDPIVQFHQKHFFLLVFLFGHAIPMAIPLLLTNYTFMECFHMHLVSWVFLINGTWSVNSAAHLWGRVKPYDRSINPVETKLVSFITGGEGWHNYHHTFPWDYKASEWSYYLNNTTLFIDFFAKIGWAYDLKQPSMELVESTVKKCGDGSHFKWGHYVVQENESMEEHFKTN